MGLAGWAKPPDSGGNFHRGVAISGFQLSGTNKWHRDYFTISADDNSLMHMWYDDKAYADGWCHGWESLGGELCTAPSAVSWGKNRIDVVAQGFDGRVYHKWWNDGQPWSEWEGINDDVFSPLGVSISSFQKGRLDVFAVGTDGALWHTWHNDGDLGPHGEGGFTVGWESLGGVLTSAPAVSTPDANENMIDVFALGQDKGVWRQRWIDKQGWSGWQSFGGGPFVSLAATYQFPVTFLFAIRESDRHLLMGDSTGDFSAGADLGGPYDGIPAALGGDVATEQYDPLRFAALGDDHQLWVNYRVPDPAPPNNGGPPPPPPPPQQVLCTPMGTTSNGSLIFGGTVTNNSTTTYRLTEFINNNAGGLLVLTPGTETVGLPIAHGQAADVGPLYNGQHPTVPSSGLPVRMLLEGTAVSGNVYIGANLVAP